MKTMLSSPGTYAGRQARAFDAIRVAGLEAFIAVHPTTLHWLTGLDAKSYQAFQCAFLDGRDGSLTLLTREGEHAEIVDGAIYDHLAGWSAFRGEDPMAVLDALLRTRDLEGACGVEVVQWYMTPAQYLALGRMLGKRFVEAADLVNDLRLIRSPEELDCLRRAGSIAGKAMSAFSEALAAGRRECDLAAAIYGAILTGGGEAPPVPLNLSGGRRAAYPHGAPTDRVLGSPESGTAEFAVPWKRYTVSIGRTYALGTVPPMLGTLYDAVVRSQEAMLAVVRAGVAVRDIFHAGMEVFRVAGVDSLVAHTIGYSVAPAFPPATGERLNLSAKSDRKLEAGMTLSIAPNLFSKSERLGARLVNNIIAWDEGYERLANSDDALIVRP